MEKMSTLYTWTLKGIIYKVPYKCLLKKLRGYGIRGKVYAWIKVFLTNGKQRVVVNGQHSEWKKVNSGIPQG